MATRIWSSGPSDPLRSSSTPTTAEVECPSVLSIPFRTSATSRSAISTETGSPISWLTCTTICRYATVRATSGLSKPVTLSGIGLAGGPFAIGQLNPNGRASLVTGVVSVNGSGYPIQQLEVVMEQDDGSLLATPYPTPALGQILVLPDPPGAPDLVIGDTGPTDEVRLERARRHTAQESRRRWSHRCSNLHGPRRFLDCRWGFQRRLPHRHRNHRAAGLWVRAGLADLRSLRRWRRGLRRPQYSWRNWKRTIRYRGPRHGGQPARIRGHRQLRGRCDRLWRREQALRMAPPACITRSLTLQLALLLAGGCYQSELSGMNLTAATGSSATSLDGRGEQHRNDRRFAINLQRRHDQRKRGQRHDGRDDRDERDERQQHWRPAADSGAVAAPRCRP